MKIRESALWKSLRKYLPKDVMAERLENSVSNGMPDVIATRAGKTFLVELKADPDEISRKQADWARRWAMAGGTSWFLICTNNAYYLVPGPSAVRLLARPEILYKWRVDSIHHAIERMLE